MAKIFIIRELKKSMSYVCACDQRRQCLENRPIDLES